MSINYERPSGAWGGHLNVELCVVLVICLWLGLGRTMDFNRLAYALYAEHYLRTLHYKDYMRTMGLYLWMQHYCSVLLSNQVRDQYSSG